jgi:Tfp pilus assembly protein PilF
VDHADYEEKAKTEFEEILKQDPGNAGALRGLGYGYLRKQDFDHAREYFAKAVERDAKDPWVLYHSAMLFRQDNGEASENAMLAPL